MAVCDNQASDPEIGADHIPFLGRIALPARQQALQFLPELSQLLDPGIDPPDLPLQLDLDVSAGQIAGVVNRQDNPGSPPG